MQAIQSPLTVLGIETSCDETAASIVRLHRDQPDGRVEVLSSIIASQVDEHAPYGGVVPEIAARSHVDHLDAIVKRALVESGLDWPQIDGVAATAGPGLIGGVMVGLMTAKGIALARGLPLMAVNHLEGHALSPRLGGAVPFPYLLLLVSGGHCQLLSVNGLGDYHRLGTTIDDAAGEAFDKTAKILGLGQPGGPAVEAHARNGDAFRFNLPRPLKGRPGCDFSFAGLKTAVLRTFEALAQPSEQDIADLCASFQLAVADVLVDRTSRAMAAFQPSNTLHRFVVAGGVAANSVIRERLEQLCAHNRFSFSAPPMKWCTDNAAMIALAGAERLSLGMVDPLDALARPRWPLDAASAASTPSHKPGRKGAKA